MNTEDKDFSFRTWTIAPESGWQSIDFGELCQYRDLFYFLVWREIKALYAQTILGFAWAVINPLVQIVIFTIVFGHVAGIATEGLPYFLYATVAVVPWTYMSTAMVHSSQSLVASQNMLGKIYFPRLIFPLAPVLSTFVDFLISLLIVMATTVYYLLHGYDVMPTWNLLLLPLFLVNMMIVPAAVGLWLSSLSIRFRDVKFAMPFVVRMLMYTAPIVYSVENLSYKARFFYSLNPIVGVIESLRACLLGMPLRWDFVLPGMVTGILLFCGGAIYFRHTERVFVDVI